MKDKNPSLSLAPRGLSRLQAAAYIGVSVTFFDQLVDDGRMPVPKRLNSRKIWDRWAVDAAFDALPDDDLRQPKHRFAELAGDGPRIDVVDEARRKYREWLGYDPTNMSKDEIAAAEANRLREWRDWVVSQPLDKRERAAMEILLQHRDRMVLLGETKGAGPATTDKLEAREFVRITMDRDRFIGWQITAKGASVFADLVRSERKVE